MSQLTELILNSLHECLVLLSSDQPSDLIVQRLESIQLALDSSQEILPWRQIAMDTVATIIQILSNEATQPSRSPGRQRISLPVADIEYLFSIKFKLVDIARMFGVSKDTVSRRLREAGIQVSQTYSAITEEDLHSQLQEILVEFPSTGYKRMKGFLLSRGIKIPDRRVRMAMRIVDPEGVYHRTRSNRAIVRREYRMTYFKELWHLDTNMKLIRWNFVIRCCIDGKSRVVVYLDASGDNSALSNFSSFLNSVSKYGVPFRTRSDKGGENVSIAEFMIHHRGTGRGSHICGRSVHNQRIERYWRDVYYGFTAMLKNVFIALEQDGLLNIDNPKHLALLHYVFVDRINSSLETFRLAWNNHPLSSESNYSPNQLMILSMPPEDQVLELPEPILDDYRCQTLEDVQYLIDATEDSIVSPVPVSNCLSEAELARLALFDHRKPSNALGYDVFVEALSFLDP